MNEIVIFIAVAIHVIWLIYNLIIDMTEKGD